MYLKPRQLSFIFQLWCSKNISKHIFHAWISRCSKLDTEQTFTYSLIQHSDSPFRPDLQSPFVAVEEMLVVVVVVLLLSLVIMA